ncbi:MAG: hypothetical protein QMD78_06150 [Methanocellales archaeon]|nr:hypothetical protein [Methanocellales archaeon]
MDQAKYEWIKAVRKARDALREQKRYGDAGHLARKIAARREHFEQKRRATDRNLEVKKQARISREHSRWDRKSSKWSAKGERWGKRWEHKAAKFNARMARRFG